MERFKIIQAVGSDCLTSNIENGEFSYPKAFKAAGIPFEPVKGDSGRAYQFLDLRFVSDSVSLLVETKNDFDRWHSEDEEQLAAYVAYEERLTRNRVVAMVANTEDDRIKVWRDAVDSDHYLPDEVAIRSMGEYVTLLQERRTNNREVVMRNTYELNEKLHRVGVNEKLRSQFVGTCLLAIKNGLAYSRDMTTKQIISGIHDILEGLLQNSLTRAEKLALIDKRVLQDQDVRQMPVDDLCGVLDFIRDRIYPFINDRSTAGQDLLNLFFVTFNKYVGKADKNQAFTPDHITDLMAKLVNVNKSSVVLDMACGSGSFLVRAMTQALADCHTKAEEDEVKRHHIYGVEYDEMVYGLATTNMLIHGDGNSNIVNGSCFDIVPQLMDGDDGVRFDTVLMNPPYNAQRKQMPRSYTDTWASNAKQDPSKGLYFLQFALDQMNAHNLRGRLAVLLPMSAAIGNRPLLRKMKCHVLASNTLDAVLSLPDEIFYPGAAVCACCMVFDVGIPHKSSNRETFFAYCKDDGFIKRKNLGRVEQADVDGHGVWPGIEAKWLKAYRNRDVVTGFSARQMVDGDDEWLCEAYMVTDYSMMRPDDLRRVYDNYVAYLAERGRFHDLIDFISPEGGPGTLSNLSDDGQREDPDGDDPLNTDSWVWFDLGGSNGLFNIKKGKRLTAADQTTGTTPYIGAIDSHNGLANLIGQTPIHDGNTISLSYNGSVGEAFYQPDPYWATDDVNALYLKPAYGTLTAWTGLFVCAVLRQNKYRFSYGRKWTLENMNTTQIKLPANSDGLPDWKLMETMMKRIPYCGVAGK